MLIMFNDGEYGIRKKDGTCAVAYYQIRVSKKRSKNGIDNGKILMLHLEIDGKQVAGYDGEWNMKPTCNEAELVLDALLEEYN